MPKPNYKNAKAGHKICRKCKHELPEADFYKMKGSPDGLHYYCKKCCKVRRAGERVKARDKKSKISVRQRLRAKDVGAPQVDKEVTLHGLYMRDNGICKLCGKFVPSNEASIDHIKPLSKGGEHTWDNVQLVHVTCNKKKGAKYGEVSAKTKKAHTRK